MSKSGFYILLLTALFCGISLADSHSEGELSIQTGKYRITKTTKTNFDTVAATRTTEECITDPDIDPESILPNKENCKINNLKTSGNKTTFEFICKESGKSSELKGYTEYSTTNNMISSTVKLDGTFKGKKLLVESSATGERLGDCLSGPDIPE